MLQFIFIFWGHHDHVWHMPEKSIVEGSMVCGAVLGYQPAPINTKHDRQVLGGHIMYHLVIRPLQERRIHGHNRLDSLGGQSSRKGDSMLFGNTHIVYPVRE